MGVGGEPFEVRETTEAEAGDDIITDLAIAD